MKKIVSLFMGALIAVSTSISTFGAVGTIYNGKTMVPVRGVFEELGFTVTWDSASATAVISDSNYTIQVPKGKTYFMVNGQSIKPDVPQQVINGSLYLPLRAIGDSVGAATSWDSTNKMAHISYNSRDSYVSCAAKNNSNSSSSSQNLVRNGVDLLPLEPHDILGEDYTLYFKENSVNGICVWGGVATNKTGKTINYYTVHYETYNPVGDPAYCEIKHTNKFTMNYVGPAKPGAKIYLGTNDDPIGYMGACNLVVITHIDLIYSDNTKETLQLGYMAYEKY